MEQYAWVGVGVERFERLAREGLWASALSDEGFEGHEDTFIERALARSKIVV